MEVEFQLILTSQSAQELLGFSAKSSLGETLQEKNPADWTSHLSQSVAQWPLPRELLAIGHAAFHTFLQANVTGPPLRWDPAKVILAPGLLETSDKNLEIVRKQIVSGLSSDGEAIYQLTPYIELFYLAKCIFNSILLAEDLTAVLGRLRVNFWHQRLLSGVSPVLQDKIYQDLQFLDLEILEKGSSCVGIDAAKFLVERATIHIHHGFDAKASDDLIEAARRRSFHFALTGRLGKRTRYQQKELSQLVVLAKSAESKGATIYQEKDKTVPSDSTDTNPGKTAPKNLNLNDDTLLESISFSEKEDAAPVDEVDELSQELRSLEPGHQPLLDPLDSIILLATASSISNTSPADGLTREETLPYAERVISVGSSNWQIYTQALLVRSRLEGYRTRTIERGVLQLQALVDQVIAETTISRTSDAIAGASNEGTVASFLPQPKQSESASLSERLEYIHQLATPPRWKLESELADRWVSLGGLRTALEIYERLQMWAEVALCWAANDREDKARDIIQDQLYHPTTDRCIEASSGDEEDNDKSVNQEERNPLSADAPRLFCILGDIEKSTAAYERAWEISNYRYARAQRSLGKLYVAAGDLHRADEAYTKSLKVNPQNHPTWFALGCVRLQAENWVGAVDAFGRALQGEDTDAESWSNLAVALLKLPPKTSPGAPDGQSTDRESLHEDKENPSDSPQIDSQKHVREAFVALKRAATLKRDSFRIWQNMLSVSVKLSPPPFTDIIVAQSRLIDLLGKLEGEKCVDVEIVEALVAHLIATTPTSPTRDHESKLDGDQNGDQTRDLNGAQPNRRTGLEKMVVELVQHRITPLITSSRRLWLIVAKLSLHLRRPSATLLAYEKAWRVTLNQPTWDNGGSTGTAKVAWKDVVEATIDLADAYESLGERTVESGMAAGELVAKDWKFKARSAVRSVLARAKDAWEDDQGFESLQARLQELKSS